MSRPTYDETRAEATPCLGGCGKLCTHGPRYCRECLGKRVDVAVGKFLARPDTEGGRP